MATGKTHAAITVMASGATAYVMWKYGTSPEAIRLTVTGCLSGTFFSPDLDVDAGFLGHAWVEKYFGKVSATIWKIIWWPYANFIPHRSWVSHAPLISTLLRVAYWYFVYRVVCILFGLNPYVPSWFTAIHVLSGLMISDTLHYVTDVLSTFIKRRQNAKLYFPMSEMQNKNSGRARYDRPASQKTQRVRRSTG